MPSLQYVIDTICSSLTEESMYQLIEGRLNQGAFTVDEILPLIKEKDRSLDTGSAKMLAEVALESLVRSGNIIIEGGRVRPVK